MIGENQIGVGYVGDTQIGDAYQRARLPSEFGLPEGYEDPSAYQGKTPASDCIIGIPR